VQFCAQGHTPCPQKSIQPSLHTTKDPKCFLNYNFKSC